MESKKQLLEIYAKEINGKPVINWDYKENINAWSMIGILETIKKELLDLVDEKSLNALEVEDEK